MAQAKTRPCWSPLQVTTADCFARPDFDKAQRCDFEEVHDAFCPLIGFRQKERIHRNRPSSLRRDATMATVEQPTVPATDVLSSNVTNSSTPAQQNHDTPNIPADPAMKMTDNGPAKSGAATDTAAAGIPFYEKRRQDLKELIAKKRALEKRLVRHPPPPPPPLHQSPATELAITDNPPTPGRRRRLHLPEGNRIPRDHARRQHRRGLRQLH